MKYINKILIITIPFVVALLSTGCPGVKNSIEKNRIYARIKNPSFEGNWEEYNRGPSDPAARYINAMRIDFTNSILFKPPLALDEDVKFVIEDGIHRPSVTLDDTITYVSEHTETSVSSNTVETHFYNRQYVDFAGFFTYILRDNSGFHYLMYPGTLNDITLIYYLTDNTGLVFDVDINDDEQANFKFNDDALVNFTSNVKQIKNSEKLVPFSINLAVMAEGYRADQISTFRAYVEDAFKSHENFNFTENGSGHKHFKNKFYEKYWRSSINVFMYETISPQAGISKDIHKNEVMSFFKYNSSSGRIDTSRMVRVIDESSKKINQLQGNVDACIILVNDNDISSYCSAYDRQVATRWGQPVNYIIIKAPVSSIFNTTKYNVTDDDFHDHVETDQIGQLLGRAMAKLMKENRYDNSEDRLLMSYYDYYRNICNKGGDQVKWKKLWDNADYRIPGYYAADNDYRLSEFKHPYYSYGGRRFECYIPAENCVMRGDKEKAYYQFDPICTYHMEGSFRARMTINNMHNQDPQFDGDDYDTYEWKGYSIEDFMKEYKPEYFSPPEE